ncbi:hypothetical protein LTS18_008507 [Coniosporium uncinatum]|uniref:Uncharacterized protein n=1 Tax=Coniosporium uncinatum TaxID=93489 RepID=A0ACC3DA84_9PEZI|nr:hypothetical protein LTS18_008507 [Coniosporium uncinatum]
MPPSLWKRLYSASPLLVGRLTSKRANDSCSGRNFTSKAGLQFDVSCNAQIPSSDNLYNNANSATSLVDCMNQCATNTNDLCYGVTFETDSGNCWLKNSDTSSPTSNQTTHAAIANTAQFQATTTACGFSSSSMQNSTDGEPFQIYCNTDMGGFDLHPNNFPTWPIHADSFQECLDVCSQSHDNCAAVAYNPGMEKGYANCYPKSISTGNVVPRPNSEVVVHFAVADLPSLSSACDPNVQVTANDTSVWDISCNVDRAARDIIDVHADSLDDCVAQCANWGSNADCEAAVWDPKMTKGYLNCYLKAVTGAPRPQQNFQVALKTAQSGGNGSVATNGTDDSGVRGESDGDGGGSHASVGAIAGGVVGGVVGGLAIAGIAFFFWRRNRKAKRAGAAAGYGGVHGPATPMAEASAGGRDGADKRHFSNPPAYYQAPETLKKGPEPIHEAGGGQVHEMASEPVAELDGGAVYGR